MALNTTNCTNWGGINKDQFGYFTPLVGKYVALASLVCTICIGMDIYRSFRWRKPWIAAKYFPLNAATLTVLAVAIKIPSDISEMMPGLFDQLAKTSAVALVCISINHMMPSLGVMSDLTILSNAIAVAIFVITLFVNIMFQFQTGLISRFFWINLQLSLAMLFIFSIFISHAITVTTIKKLLTKQYESKHQQIQSHLTTDVFPVEQLRDYMNRYWLLALTSSPDYALRSSGIAYVSAMLCGCLVGLGFIIFASGLVLKQWHDKTTGCYVRSDYKSSSGYVFLVQAVAIVAGTLASLLRGVNSEEHDKIISLRYLLKVERYRIQKLEEWRDAPLPFHVRNKRARRLAYMVMSLTILCVMLLQKLITFLTKLLFLLAHCIGLLPFLPGLLLSCCFRCMKQGTDEENLNQDVATEDIDPDDLETYVLHLEGISTSSPRNMEKWLSLTNRWIEKGGQSKPKALRSFLENFSKPSEDFPKSHVYSHGLPDCWSLTLVTLATVIRTAFKNVQQEDELLTSLKEATDECFKYATFVDKNCCLMEGSTKKIKAARKVWDSVDLFHNWMNEDLSKVVDKGDPLAVIQELRRIADECLTDGSPLKVEAAKYLSSIAGTISAARDQQRNLGPTSGIPTSMLPLLRSALADTMGACLVNLPRAILKHCSSGQFGDREDKVREAAVILGEAEDILQWLADKRTVP